MTSALHKMRHNDTSCFMNLKKLPVAASLFAMEWVLVDMLKKNIITFI